jgi:nucleoside-diphosphate-sugar epimerase
MTIMDGMERGSRIFVAGHRGLVGSAIVRGLHAQGHDNLITRTRAQLDLEDAAAVSRMFDEERPEFVFLAAAISLRCRGQCAYDIGGQSHWDAGATSRATLARRRS